MFFFEKEVNTFKDAYKTDPDGHLKAAEEIEDMDDVLKNIQNKLFYDSDSDGEYFDQYQKFLSDRKDMIIIDSTIKSVLQ